MTRLGTMTVTITCHAGVGRSNTSLAKPARVIAAPRLVERTTMTTNDAADKESIECPTCGKDDFSTVSGMKNHHRIVHGEKLPPGKAVECAWCGETIRREPWQIEKYDHQFCDESECYAKFRAENFAGEDSPSWKGGPVTLTCEWCDNDYEKARAQAERSRYCSRECKGEAIADDVGLGDYNHGTGEDHPSWQGGPAALTCEWCGDDFHDYREDRARFCSRTCRSRGVWGKNAEVDPDEWEPSRSYYGPSWPTQRQRALDRDGHACRVCDTGDDLQVHHIVKFDQFGLERYEEANRLDNLLTVCRDHHAVIEKWSPLVPPNARLIQP